MYVIKTCRSWNNLRSATWQCFAMLFNCSWSPPEPKLRMRSRLSSEQGLGPRIDLFSQQVHVLNVRLHDELHSSPVSNPTMEDVEDVLATRHTMHTTGTYWKNWLRNANKSAHNNAYHCRYLQLILSHTSPPYTSFLCSVHYCYWIDCMGRVQQHTTKTINSRSWVK